MHIEIKKRLLVRLNLKYNELHAMSISNTCPTVVVFLASR